MQKKYLILALSGIGDALMFTPAIKALRELEPQSQIDSIVMFKGALDIYNRLPELNNVYFHDFINSSKINSLKFILSFRKKYDASINVYPANRKEYNLINLLTGSSIRVGVRYNRDDFKNLGWLNNSVIFENDSLHNVEENILQIEKLTDKKVSEISPLLFPLNKADFEFSENYLIENEISKNDLIIGFHAGCSTLKNHINRRWEPAKFAELGKKLIVEKNAKILIFGGPDENELKNNIYNQINSENCIVVNAKKLSQSAAIMKRTNVFVTNDSSLMHVSSALGLNVVAIIGPTNTNYIKPWQTNHKIVSLNLDCSPCFFYSPKPLICERKDVKYKCVKELNVDLVCENVLQFI